MDETLRTLFTGISTLIAVFSFYNTISLWKKGNRPILSAFVQTELSDGDYFAMYNLSIINSGNRPAVNIYLCLKLSDDDFKKCIKKEIDNPRVQEIRRCFTREETIPLIINGENKFRYFGSISSRISEQDIWIYGSSLPIEINYQDIEGNKYVSKFTLVVKSSRTSTTFLPTEWS